MVSNIVDNTDTTTVDEKLLKDSNGKSNSTKQKHFNTLKTKTNIIYTVVAIIATALSSFYSYFSVKLARDSINNNDDKFSDDFTKILMLRWINSAIFTVWQIFMSLSMMCLLRVRFA